MSNTSKTKAILFSTSMVDAIREGVEDYESFKKLWESINGKDSWNHHIYVFVYDFKITEKPKDFLSKIL